MNLSDLLSQPDLSVSELFQRPDILNEIKSKLELFVDFCKRNEDFTKIMITLGIKTPMQKKKEQFNMHKISNVANSILTCDNDIIADLFIMDQQRIRLYSQDSEEIIQQIVTNQETGELVIADHKEKQDDDKYLHLLDLLSYFEQKYINENCINYLAKVLNILIRVKHEQLFQFFTQKPQYLAKWIQLTVYPSLSYTLVKFLNETEDVKHHDIKLNIVNMVVKELLQKVKDQNFYIHCEFVDEAFDKNRHRSEQRDSFKIITQPLVDMEIIDAMITMAFGQSSPTVISNSLLYLGKVIQRMNVDEQKDPYSYVESTETPKPTMNFHWEPIFKQFNKFVSLAQKITRAQYSPIQILNYYDFLLAMCRNSHMANVQIDLQKNANILIQVLNTPENRFNGIIKNKVVLLLEAMMKGKIITVNQEMQLELKKFTNVFHSESNCFKEKLQILFYGVSSKAAEEFVIKYSGVLASFNDCTQKRVVQIKELDFAKKKLPEIRAKQQKILNKTDQSINKEQNQLTISQKIQKEDNSTLGLNYTNLISQNDLKDKIKKKKSQKTEEEIKKVESENEREVKDLDLGIKINQQQKKDVNKVGQQNQKQQKSMKKEQIVNYYARHLILF